MTNPLMELPVDWTEPVGDIVARNASWRYRGWRRVRRREVKRKREDFMLPAKVELKLKVRL
jgi:hypothetical protein